MSREARIWALASGLLLYLFFFGLQQTWVGLSIVYRPPWTFSSPGEIYFWLASMMLLTPSACLMGLALSTWIGPCLGWLGRRVAAMTPQERVAGLLMLLCVGVGLARSMHAIFLGDLPFTDDEYAARFGGQILATGQAMAARPRPFDAFPTLFLYARGGRWTSFDFLGVQLAWAFSELTGTGPLIFSLAAALPVVCVGAVAGWRLGSPAALLAVAIFAASPMAASLSMVTHAHVLSRAAVAAALALFVRAQALRSLRAWSWTGLAVGVGLMCRPFEVGILLFPLFLTLAADAREDAGARRAIAGVALGLTVPLASILLHNWAVTGAAWLPVRMAPNEIVHPYAAIAFHPPFSPGRLWPRFGANLAYNAFMLSVWFLGLPGMLLVACGMLTDRFTRRLGAGVALALAMAMFHDDQGIHVVGPIHYSECAVPLTILAAHGARNLREWASGHRIAWEHAASALAVFLLLACGTFTLWNAGALRRHARIHQTIYRLVDHSGLRNAILLAPPFPVVWQAVPEVALQGSWVFEWRRPRPRLDDEVLIAFDGTDVAALRANFPSRRLYRLVISQDRPLVRIAPVP